VKKKNYSLGESLGEGNVFQSAMGTSRMEVFAGNDDQLLEKKRNRFRKGTEEKKEFKEKLKTPPALSREEDKG